MPGLVSGAVLRPLFGGQTARPAARHAASNQVPGRRSRTGRGRRRPRRCTSRASRSRGRREVCLEGHRVRPGVHRLAGAEVGKRHIDADRAPPVYPTPNPGPADEVHAPVRRGRPRRRASGTRCGDVLDKMCSRRRAHRRSPGAKVRPSGYETSGRFPGSPWSSGAVSWSPLLRAGPRSLPVCCAMDVPWPATSCVATAASPPRDTACASAAP